MGLTYNPLIFSGFDMSGTGGGGSGANSHLSNLISPIQIPDGVNLAPLNTNAADIGDLTHRFANAYFSNVFAGNINGYINDISGGAISLQGGNTVGQNIGGQVTIVGGQGFAGDGGDVLVQPGPGSTAGARLRLKSAPGATNTVGQVWTATDTSGAGDWMNASSGANQSLSNLTNPTSINQDLRFAGTGTIFTPAGSSLILQTANNFAGTAGRIDLDPGLDGSPTGRGQIRLFTNDLIIQTDNFTTIRTQDSVNAGLNIQTGSPGGVAQSGSLGFKTGDTGSGNSGSISLTIGSTSGTKGTINLKDGSESLGAGAIWTLQDTAGTGHWQAAGSSGANTSLSNLTSPTALNQDLIWASATPGTLQTFDQSGGLGTQNLTIRTGSSSNNTSGALLVESGPGTGTFGGSGNATFQSGNSAGQSGDVFVLSGTSGNGDNSGVVTVASSPGAGSGSSSGNIDIHSGTNTGTGSSGNILLTVGTTTGTRGNFKFLKTGVASVSGQVWTASATDGTGYWANALENRFRIVTTTTSISASTDYKVLANQPGGGSFNLNLPAGVQGLSFVLAQSSGNTATVTISPNGGDVLDANIQAIFNNNLPVPVCFDSGSGTWYAI